MKILQINIRASQGGAGRVALDLHRRLRAADVDSRLLYGYGSGVTDDPAVVNDPTIVRLGTKAAVLTNYASHLLLGYDVITGHPGVLKDSIRDADIVHVHAPHHYFMNWNRLVALVRQYRKPMILTAHDWWFISGRCGLPDGCMAWARSCGECGERRFKDLPTLFDRSRHHRRAKIESINSLGSSHFICPAEHLAGNYRSVYPKIPIEVVPNSIDAEFESALTEESAGSSSVSRHGFLFSAADLNSSVKIDRTLLESLAAQPNTPLILAGKNNPFKLPNAEALGEVRDRRAMVRVLRRARALVFCSVSDNAPLTVIEALAAGCHVLAYSSPATDEIIGKVGGRTVKDRATMSSVITENRVEELYGGIDSPELSRRALALFSGRAMAEAHIRIYNHVLAAVC